MQHPRIRSHYQWDNIITNGKIPTLRGPWRIPAGFTSGAVLLASAVCFAAAGYFWPADREAAVAVGAIGAVASLWALHRRRRVLASVAALRTHVSEAERQLESERRTAALLRHAADSLSDGFALWDVNGRLIAHNRRSPPGGRPDISDGITFDQYLDAMYPLIDAPDQYGSKETWRKERTRLFAEANGSHEVKIKSGKWYLITERRTDEGGTLTIYTDISDIKRAEESRELSENRLAMAQKLARIGVFEWDIERQDMYWSDYLYEIVGLPPDSPALGLEQFLLLVHPSSRDLVRSTFARLLSTGGQYNQEYEIVRPDGQSRSVRTVVQAIADDRGRVVRILGSMHDQTETKRTERALRRAKETAVDANIAKSEFLANVSHELRTPLNAIIGFSEVMLQEVFGPVGNSRYREYANDIRDSGTHLLGVINDLLDFSKLEAGRLELRYERVEIGAVVEKCVRMMHQHAESQDVAIVNNTPDFSRRIEIDERKVTQILLNLISNSIKFTPAGGIVSLSVGTAGNGVDITVADTGVGMSDDDIQTALLPFGQVDSSLNREHTGTGLGLPLSKSLAELHSGSLDIVSRPGQGTTITVHLPERQTEQAGPPLQLVIGGQDG